VWRSSPYPVGSLQKASVIGGIELAEKIRKSQFKIGKQAALAA
jgi:hypothetical protein